MYILLNSRQQICRGSPRVSALRRNTYQYTKFWEIVNKKGKRAKMPDELLSAALGYESIGWSVIPVRPDKKPYISWLAYQRGRATPEQIMLWWRDYKDAQIGIVTGNISNVVVVDLDGSEGITSFEKLDDGEPTVYSKTGSGGRHYFYAMPKDGDEAKLLRNFARRKGIDLRANGGYVVVPPSENQKGRYEWRISPDNQMPSDCPKWIIDACKVGQTFLSDGEQKQSRMSVLPSLENGVDEGSRNDSAARLAGHFFGQGKTKTEVSAELVEWNLKNRPPLELSELEQVVVSIGRTRAYKAGTYAYAVGTNAYNGEPKSDTLRALSEDTLCALSGDTPYALSGDTLCALSDGERGDAKLFVKLYRDRFCYDSSQGTWYEWKGHFWAPDRIREARASVEGVIQIYKGQIFLSYVAFLRIVGVFVALSVSEFFHKLRRGVANVERDGQRGTFLDVFLGHLICGVYRIALRGCGKVDCRLSERKFTLGGAEKVKGVLGGYRYGQRARVGVSHVL